MGCCNKGTGRKFYPLIGEGEKLTPKQKKLSKESIKGCKEIYIPELRIHVFTKQKETKKETRERYLKKYISVKNKNESNKVK